MSTPVLATGYIIEHRISTTAVDPSRSGCILLIHLFVSLRGDGGQNKDSGAGIRHNEKCPQQRRCATSAIGVRQEKYVKNYETCPSRLQEKERGSLSKLVLGKKPAKKSWKDGHHCIREISLSFVSDRPKRTLVQVVRNIAMWTFKTQEGLETPQRDYRERSLWDPLVEPLLDLATETESHELLVEVCEYATNTRCRGTRRLTVCTDHRTVHLPQVPPSCGQG